MPKVRPSVATARNLVLGSLMGLAFASSAPRALAQPRRAKPAKPAPKPAAEIELDAPAAAAAKPQDDSPPPQPGKMTQQAAQAKRLFDGEKWSDAALALYKVYKGETGDDEGNKQLAQYHLAIALYRMKFYQAAYAYFSEIPTSTTT